VQQAANDARQELNRLAQQQQQGQQLRQSQQQAQQAMQQLAQGGGLGGSDAGTGDSGARFLPQQGLSAPYRVRDERDAASATRGGKSIVSWRPDGQVERGESTVTHDTAVTEARHDAEQAVTEDRVPKRYHGPIRDYFNQLPAPSETTPAKAGND